MTAFLWLAIVWFGLHSLLSLLLIAKENEGAGMRLFRAVMLQVGMAVAAWRLLP